MSKDIIEKLFQFNNDICPKFIYSNALLDKNITTALSNSIVKTLDRNNQIGNIPKVRTAILKSLRNMCKTAPEGHVEIDEDLTELLTSYYEKQLIKLTGAKNIDKQLDSFLIRNSKSTNPTTSFSSSVNPEVLQALLNLNSTVIYSENTTKDILHWNIDDQKTQNVVQNLWNEDITREPSFYDDIATKMKSKIEYLLLNKSYMLLQNNISVDDVFSDSEIKSLVKNCSNSAESFQITTSILNSLLIMTHFNTSIEKFIFFFIQNVKSIAKSTISTLYTYNLSNLVIILDMEVEKLPVSVRQSYVETVLRNLKILHENSENDVIMLLSHFPQWFNIYFDD